jgi:Putative peptidoglycan binding domain
MNKLIYSACVGTLALAASVQAADINDTNTPKRARGTTKASTTQATSVKTSNAGQANVHRNYSGARYQQRSSLSTNRNLNNSMRVNRNRVRTNDLSVSRERNMTNRNLRRNTVNHVDVNRSKNLTVNRTRNIDRTGRNVQVNSNRNVTVNRQRNVVVNNNWRRFNGQQYAAFRNYHRQWHDRNWWSHNYSRITFVFGAPYYWNSGYWYPAWGYSPGVSYMYDGPIYGYNNLTPDQVVVNVQSQLQRDGYYSGPVDGQLGPMTRQAIADFQADHGLAVTSAVDEPTLATLGLV